MSADLDLPSVVIQLLSEMVTEHRWRGGRATVTRESSSLPVPSECDRAAYISQHSLGVSVGQVIPVCPGTRTASTDFQRASCICG